jgi:5'-nucleotidase
MAPFPVTNAPRIARGPVAVALLMVLALIVPAGALAAKSPPPVTIQFLNVSDWHGNLDPVNGFGGAWNISARWKVDRAAYPTLTLTAGDDFGATPPLSGFFNEDPSIKAQRMMGIQVGTLGNHNFDRGVGHLQQMIDLAGASTSATAPGTPFAYVSANLKHRNQNVSGVKDYAMFTVGGVQVAVVGVTNPEAPGLVFPGSFGTIVPTDPVAAAMNAQREARRAGAQVVVAITHMGVRGFSGGEAFGELVDFATATSGFDVIFGDHTDIQYQGTINGQLVHENRSFGVTYAKTLVTVAGGKKGAVLDKSVSFVSPAAGTLTGGTTCPASPAFCDQAIVDMLVPYRTELSALLDEVIGTSAGLFPRGSNVERSREVATGDLIADGMAWRYGTQLGYMNSGGIRRSLPADNYAPADTSLRRLTVPPYQPGPPYDLVKGDVYTVLPFNNVITTRSVTGDQLWAMLENGVSQISATGSGADGRFPQIAGLRFTYRSDIATGCTGGFNTPSWECSTPARVQSVSLLDGTPIAADATTYTMALPNFVNLGGDGYTMLNDAQGVTRELDAAVMLAYIESLGGALDPSIYPLDRITRLIPTP